MIKYEEIKSHPKKLKIHQFFITHFKYLPIIILISTFLFFLILKIYKTIVRIIAKFTTIS